LSAAAGGLTLNNRTISGTVPAVNVNGGGFGGGAVILLAVVLAVAGGIIAGIFGGWRAARLRPAAALAKVA
jgi:ABC-type antimicrobial peptide transport system permease subunit